MQSIIDFFERMQSPMDLDKALTAMVVSLIASVIVYFMYQFFYGSRYIGAGVHRTFIIGGPAITALFLGIQVSIPLSLGLLGALSFVRFRTPVKDPAEIGFILLLIASSIGAATANYVITGILFGLVLIALVVQWLLRNRFSVFGRGNLMISIDQPAFAALNGKLDAFLRERLGGAKLENMSVIDGRVSLNYHYRRRNGLNWTAFTNDLVQMAAPARVEVFVG